MFLPNSSTISDTLNFGLTNNTGINNVSISGPSLTTTDSNDTVTLNALSIPGNLTVSAETINFQGGNTVDASYMALTSMNSLTFTSTGMPYLGAITPNAAPPAGQPFAGDTYITGPDWGAYGYAPGDEITISNATNVSSTTDYSVAAIIGDNLYLTPALPSNAIPPNATVSDGDVTVAPANFTPELEGTLLNLIVTGPGSSISGAIEADILEGSTQNGNITLQNVDPTAKTAPFAPLTVDTLNAGTGTIQLDVNGPIRFRVYIGQPEPDRGRGEPDDHRDRRQHRCF